MASISLKHTNVKMQEDQDAEYSETSQSLSLFGGAMLAIGLAASVGYALCSSNCKGGNSIKSISTMAKSTADAMVSAATTLTQLVTNTDIPPSGSYESRSTRKDKHEEHQKPAKSETINVKEEDVQQETPNKVDAEEVVTAESYEDEVKKAMGVRDEEHDENVQQASQEMKKEKEEKLVQVNEDREIEMMKEQKGEQNKEKELDIDATNNHMATFSREEPPLVLQKKLGDLNECNDSNRNHQAIEEEEEDVIYWSKTTIVKQYNDKSRKRKRSM